MGRSNRLEAAILPQLIPVSYLDVGKTLLVVMMESVQEERFVGAEGIRAAVVAAMAIAEEDQAHRIVERDDGRVLKHHIEPAMRQSLVEVVYSPLRMRQR